MTLTAHRPARLVSSLVADDPVELADLPHLPTGTTLDPEVLRDAACGEDDVELFYPEPGDLETERAAKQVCAGCPVREPCLEMALATGDQHAILGGTTPRNGGGCAATARSLTPASRPPSAPAPPPASTPPSSEPQKGGAWPPTCWATPAPRCAPGSCAVPPAPPMSPGCSGCTSPTCTRP
jgi:Transcription factor WhiB